jgi:hypothetical protein
MDTCHVCRGESMLIVWGAAGILTKLKINAAVQALLVVLILAALAVLSFKQITHWRNSETLYSQSIAGTRNN